MSLQNKLDWVEKMEAMVEEQFDASIKIFQNLPEDALLFSDAGEWSIAACLDHLNSYSSHYMPRIKKALKHDELAMNDFPVEKSWIGSYFIRMMEPKEDGKKYKAIKKHLPNLNTLDPYKNVADFIQALEELDAILQLAKKCDPNKGKVTSSLSPLIRLKPVDAIEFVLVHNKRHLVQAKKQIKKFQNKGVPERN
ncbi:MAG TPA: DinB family protein [Lunatimonas sp.]|nr:DinB family protein [Lunatimonas sp.]